MKVLVMPFTQAPRWKLMIRIGLERSFEFPIIQAPKRNLKRHQKMGKIAVSPRPLGRAVVCAPRVTSAVTSRARFLDEPLIPAERNCWQAMVGIARILVEAHPMFTRCRGMLDGLFGCGSPR